MNGILIGISGLTGWIIGKKMNNKAVSTDEKEIKIDYPLEPSGITKENARQWFSIIVIMYHFYDVKLKNCTLDERIISVCPLNSEDYFTKAIEFSNNTDSPSVLNLGIKSEHDFNQMMLSHYNIIMD